MSFASSRNTFGYVDGDGRRLVSVTEALKLAGLVDLSMIPAETLERARQRGQDVHAFCEGIALGLLDDEAPDPRIDGYVVGFRRFLSETSFKAEAAEQRVVHAVYGFAGTIDLLGAIGSASWLLDLKATAALPPEAKPQTAAYRMAKALAEKTPRRRGVLHLRPDGTYRLDEHKDHRTDEGDFLAALRVAQWRLRHGLARLED